MKSVEAQNFIVCLYRHFSIYTVSVGTYKKIAEGVNGVYLVVLKGRTIEL